MRQTIRWFAEIAREDHSSVGGKGASLGEMTRAAIPVPPGFVVTAEVYTQFLESNGLVPLIQGLLASVDPNDSPSLAQCSGEIKRLITWTALAPELGVEVLRAYHKLGGGPVAVRSSATAEDLPEASFAGQQSTYLNVRGDDELLNAVRECWASLYEARAIFYRAAQGFDQVQLAIAVVVQRMVQAEVSGVMFTVEPVSNDPQKLAIESVLGLGEAVVSGAVTPDFYQVDKQRLAIERREISRQEWKLVRNPNLSARLEELNIRVALPPEEQRTQKLSDKLILDLTRIGLSIEQHYGQPQDIEWAYENGGFFIVQARPITTLETVRPERRVFDLTVLLTGSGASPGIGSGQVAIVRSVAELGRVRRGDVLVAEMTAPDFVPAMKRAVAIVTDKGGRTCHAAIVSRELGIPCVVGTETATSLLREQAWVTVDGVQGLVYDGRVEMDAVPAAPGVDGAIRTATKVYVNLADPERVEAVGNRNVDGVGLLRAEFIVANSIKEHPRYMMERGRGREWSDQLASGIEAFAKAFHPRPVVYRTTDFKTNEYRNLKGGERYEAYEENPMIGYRGASRYLREPELFRLETEAIHKVWVRYPNLCVMVPFVRSPAELTRVKELLAEAGLAREKGLKLWMMCEVPTNVILLEKYLEVGLDGVSIGSNDLTQLILGIDRDNEKFTDAFDERDPAILWCLERVVRTCAGWGVTTSICGQAPSDYPDLTEKLVHWGITSVSVSPDMIERTREIVAHVERRLGKLPPPQRV